ncbi:toll-like receptor 13 [Ostrea edulis]|uniref:toll-like receptor 13 n=1 Tax=Ostrea edulis TaxID=37623 RepID=UPI0020940F05|nr:toll-like receptor 13 [Ostrea edulis]
MMFGNGALVIRIFVYSFCIKSAFTFVSQCGLEVCLCDYEKQTANCRGKDRHAKLPFIPAFPSGIKEVVIRNFVILDVTKKMLGNLTKLSLSVLRLRNLDIRHMETESFQSLRKLKVLEISMNTHLLQTTLTKALRSISPELTTLILSSNGWKWINSDVFSGVSLVNLRTLDMSKNKLSNFTGKVIKHLNLTTLDLSSSNFNNIDVLCDENNKVYRHLENLHLRSTRVRHISQSIFECLPQLRTLDLQNTKLGHFPEICFSSSNFPNQLRNLSLTNTGISNTVSERYCRCMSRLEALDLGKNAITDLPEFCNQSGESNVPALQKLHLSYTTITILNKESFRCLRSLKSLDLSNNVLREIPDLCDKSGNSLTPTLISLNLMNTSLVPLKTFNFPCLSKLENLDLRFNFFRAIPVFCDESGKSFQPNLRQLQLSNTKIKYVFNNSFNCLPSLKKLDLSSTEIHHLPDNVFSPLLSLSFLQIGYVKTLKKLSNYAFNVSSLHTLKFIFNDFNFEDTSKFSSNTLFQFCSNIKILHLSGNHFPTGVLASKLLKPLTHLKQLVIQSSRMDTIHRNTFESLKNLEKLSLQQNRIIGWTNDVFQNLTNLLHLNLNLNKIAVFNQTSIPPEILNKLETLGLAYNPFDCGCDMIWFKRWCQETNVTLLNFPGEYSCKTPPSMLRQSILALRITEEDCEVKNPWILIVIATSVSAGILVFSSISIAMYLPSIRNFVYYIRLRRMGYLKLLNDQDFKYDTYIVYSEADEKWIFRKVLPKLESEGLRVCIPDREFEIGADKCTQIENAFRDSKKILVILSNEFAKDEWCLWQENVVEERLRQRGDSTVVFVLYKNINSRNMIASLHRTIKRQRMITWHEGGTREAIFWKVVILALEAPIGEPPISIANK